MRNILHSKPRVTRFTIDWDDPPLVDSENIAPTAPNIQQEQSTSLSNGAKDHMMKTGDYAAGPNNTDSNSSIPDYVQDMECHWDTCKTSSVNCETNQKLLWPMPVHKWMMPMNFGDQGEFVHRASFTRDPTWNICALLFRARNMCWLQKLLWHGTFLFSCHAGPRVNDAHEFRLSRQIHGIIQEWIGV